METDTPRRPRPADRRVELYVRGLTSRTGRETRHRAITLLERLETAGVVTSFSVRVWGQEVGLSTTAVDTERGREILDRVGSIRKWANCNDLSVEPFFDSRTTTSEITGEEYTRLRLPVAALAEYVDGKLAYVTPHRECGTVRTVQNRLDQFAATLAGEPEDDTDSRRERGSPQCGRKRVSVQ